MTTQSTPGTPTPGHSTTPAGENPGAGTPGDDTPGGLRRTIRFRELMAYGLLFIAPTGIAGIFGTLYAGSHGAMTTVYAVATAVMALTALSYVQMSRAVPRAGSVFSYASAGIGPRAGFLGGWMMLLDYLIIPSVAYLFAGLALHSAIPSVPAWAFTAAAVALTTACNLRGVRFAAWVGFVVLGLEFLVLAVVMAAGIVVLTMDGPAHSWSFPLTGDSGFSLGVLTAAISVAVFSFLGFDGIASFSEENRGEARLVGRATLACLIVAGLILVAVSYVTTLLETRTPAMLAADPALQGTAFYDIITVSIAPWLSTVFAVCKALGSAFAAMVGQAAASRLLFSMSRAGTMPKMFAAVGRRSGAPTRSMLLMGGLALVVSVQASLSDSGLELLSSTANVGALFGFLLVNAAVVGYFTVRRKSTRRIPHLIVPALGGLVVIALIASTDPTAKWVSAAWLCAGILVLAIRAVRDRGGRSDSAGAFESTGL